MKVKYFLRGVGIGIIVTTIILGISYHSKMSNEAVITKARQLGMEFVEAPTKAPTESPAESPTEVPTQTPTIVPTETPTVAPSKVPASKEPKKKVTKVLTINRGDWSRIVSERLEELGIIDDSEKFDKYLVDNGYAQRIVVGDFELSSDSSYNEIAEAITE